MIEAVNKSMLSLQHALTARLTYPAGPHVDSCRDRACDTVQHMLDDRPRIDVFVLDDRVICDDQTLPASTSLLTGLFGQFRAAGIDRITFHQGIAVPEIQALLDDLAAHQADPSQSLRATDHLTFSFIKAADTPAPWDLRQESGLDTEKAVAFARDLYRDIDLRHTVNTHALSANVTAIIETVLANDAAILSLAAIKKYDEYTFVHVTNVAILSAAFGAALGFDTQSMHKLCTAALLHDIGKCHIPAKVLNKNAPMDDQEWQLMQKHPVGGAAMLLNTPGIDDLAAIVAYEHHIFPDGTGYPQVPKSWNLNFASRIVQVVDVFDALRTHRCYRAGLPVAQIIEIMQGEQTCHFGNRSQGINVYYGPSNDGNG